MLWTHRFRPNCFLNSWVLSSHCAFVNALLIPDLLAFRKCCPSFTRHSQSVADMTAVAILLCTHQCVCSWPVLLKTGYKHLREEQGYSDMSLLAMTLAVPLVTGIATLCAVDAVYVRKARQHGECSHGWIRKLL